MKALMIVAASVALALAGCNRDENAGAGRTADPSKARSSAAGGTSGSSTATPGGAASGQAAEGSTDRSSAPKRPSSKY